MIEYTVVRRYPDAFQQPVALEEIVAMCKRTFGQGIRITLVKELEGGQFNNTYLISLLNRDPIILRVAPSPKRCIFWHEQGLMRQELAMQPLLAPIAPLLPTIIMADFTHQIIDRDYLFQAYMSGTAWVDINRDLTLSEHDGLWRQFGRLVRTISSVQGSAFGLVQGGPQFPRWSLTVIDWLERTIADARSASLDTGLLCKLLELVRCNTLLLDEITQPSLLHGDLWWFNLLIGREEQGPRIAAVLDADRGSWGDPLADWTFFLLPHRATPQEQSIFWQEYGQPATSPGAWFRASVYRGLHAGKILSVAWRDGNARALNKAYRTLGNVVETLEKSYYLTGSLHAPVAC
ncbi:MAG TPA: aminoglycoside phosphotransferase family protein [Ktedonobacteraceae bacterium]